MRRRRRVGVIARALFLPVVRQMVLGVLRLLMIALIAGFSLGLVIGIALPLSESLHVIAEHLLKTAIYLGLIVVIVSMLLRARS